VRCRHVNVMSQAAAERLWQDRQEWEAGEAGRQAAAARAEAVAEREAALQRDLARLVPPFNSYCA
jgi:aspartate/methionine/tyrosine aminotransferase